MIAIKPIVLKLILQKVPLELIELAPEDNLRMRIEAVFDIREI